MKIRFAIALFVAPCSLAGFGQSASIYEPKGGVTITIGNY